LQYLLAEPELARLAEDPVMRRLLNPLCQMLGVPARPMRPARRPAAVPPRPAATDPDSDGKPAGRTPQPPPAPVAA
jgi:hypothetical protein